MEENANGTIEPLNYDDLKMIADGLAQLDGYDRVARDGAREFVVREFYKFGKGLRSLIAGNISTARTALRLLDEKNKDLIAQFAEGERQVPDKNIAEFAEAQRNLLKGSSGVSLSAFRRIKFDELDLDKNPIPPSVLSMLEPILDQPA